MPRPPAPLQAAAHNKAHSVGLARPRRSSQLSASADHSKTQLARDQVEQGDRDQDQEDDERSLLQLERPNGLGEMQADAAGTNYADDAGGPRIRFEVVQNLASEHGENLGQDAESDTQHMVAASRDDTLDRLP